MKKEEDDEDMDWKPISPASSPTGGLRMTLRSRKTPSPDKTFGGTPPKQLKSRISSHDDVSVKQEYNPSTMKMAKKHKVKGKRLSDDFKSEEPIDMAYREFVLYFEENLYEIRKFKMLHRSDKIDVDTGKVFIDRQAAVDQAERDAGGEAYFHKIFGKKLPHCHIRNHALLRHVLHGITILENRHYYYPKDNMNGENDPPESKHQKGPWDIVYCRDRCCICDKKSLAIPRHMASLRIQ